jgi:hypothetical protein
VTSTDREHQSPAYFRHKAGYDLVIIADGDSAEGAVRRNFWVLAVALPLAGCGWFGGHKDEPAATAPATVSTLSSDEVLKNDCANENWKQQNLGLWYSVCRQPMRW